MVAEGDRRMICPGFPEHQIRHTALFLETIWPIWEGERDKAGAELKRERRREERSKRKEEKGVKGRG